MYLLWQPLEQFYAKKRIQKINETRKNMLDAIGESSFNGADLFEGTTPLGRGGTPGEEAQPAGALTGTAPGDAGVDISNLMSSTKMWKKMAGN